MFFSNTGPERLDPAQVKSITKKGGDAMPSTPPNNTSFEIFSTETDPELLEQVRSVPHVVISGYCSSEDLLRNMQVAQSDRRMNNAKVSLHKGGVAFALSNIGETKADLIIVECEGTHEQILADVEKIALLCDKGTKAVIVGAHNDVKLYRGLLERGVSEYLSAPVSPADIIRTIAKLYSDESAPIGRTVAFMGARGGVGSSVISHHIAYCIAQKMERETYLLDFDFTFGTAGLNFDQVLPPALADTLRSAQRVDDVFLKRLVISCSDSLFLLPAPNTLRGESRVSAEAAMQIVDTARFLAPYVIVDLPNTWDETAKNVIRVADEVVITAIPELISLRNAKLLVDSIKKLRPNDVSPKLILNYCGVPKYPEVDDVEFERLLDIPILAKIPFAPAVFGKALNSGKLINLEDPKSAVVAEIISAARSLGRSEKPAKETKKFLHKIPFLNRIGQ